MLACETSVTTACAWAKEKRAPWAARRSRVGVAARPPYAPSASARSVSIVTRRTLRSGLGVTANERPPIQEQAARAASATTAAGSFLDKNDHRRSRRPGELDFI